MNTESGCVTTNSQCAYTCGKKCFSWSAIFLGALVAVGLSFLLNLFSTSLSLSIYRDSAEGVRNLAVGGMLGFGIGIIAVMFVSGWVAGYFGRSSCKEKHCGAVSGFAAWCLAIIMTVFLTFPLSRFTTHYSNYLTHTTVVEVSQVPNTYDTKKMNSRITTLEEQKVVNDAGKLGMVLFLMFFLGAIASTCGGHVGGCACRGSCCNCGCSSGTCTCRNKASCPRCGARKGNCNCEK